MKAIYLPLILILTSYMLGCNDNETTTPIQQQTDDTVSGCMLIEENEYKYGNRLITSYTYNEQLQLTHSKTLDKDQEVFHELDYTWDATGRISSIAGTKYQKPFSVIFTYTEDGYREATLTHNGQLMLWVSSLHLEYVDTIWHYPVIGGNPQSRSEIYYSSGNVVKRVTHEDYEMDGYFEYTYVVDALFDDMHNPHASFPNYIYPKQDANNYFYQGIEYEYNSLGYPTIYRHGYDSTVYTYYCK